MRERERERKRERKRVRERERESETERERKSGRAKERREKRLLQQSCYQFLNLFIYHIDTNKVDLNSKLQKNLFICFTKMKSRKYKVYEKIESNGE